MLAAATRCPVFMGAGPASEERRLKAGGSQDWLPHKAASTQP